MMGLASGIAFSVKKSFKNIVFPFNASYSAKTAAAETLCQGNQLL